MRRVTDARHAERALGDPPDGDDTPTPCQSSHEPTPGLDLVRGRETVRRRGAWMRRHDVPEEDGDRQTQLCQNALHDRRRRLRRTRAGELPLRGERDPRDAGAAVARRLADEQELRLAPRLEVGDQPLASQSGFPVLVERASDAGSRELLDECGRRYDGPSVTGSSGQPG